MNKDRGIVLKGPNTFTSLCPPALNSQGESSQILTVVVLIIRAGNKLLGASQCVSLGTVTGPLPHLHPLSVTSINDNSWVYRSHVTTAARLSGTGVPI